MRQGTFAPQADLCIANAGRERPLLPHTARRVGRDVAASPPCAAPGQAFIQRSEVAFGAVVVPAGRGLDLDYWVFGLTLSDEEGQG
jgi:hypothetical protein